MGRIEDSKTITWKGKDGLKTPEEMQKFLFDVDYTSFAVLAQTDKGIREWVEIESDEIYQIPYGYCKRLEQDQRKIMIQSRERNIILFVDPSKDNSIRMSRMDNGKVVFGPVGEHLYEEFTFQIEIGIKDLNIHEGISCTNYDSKGFSYGQCIQNIFGKALIDWFGCIPVWFSGPSNITCQTDANIKNPDQTLLDYMKTQFYTLVKEFNLDMFETCLPPCITMNIKIKERQNHLFYIQSIRKSFKGGTIC